MQNRKRIGIMLAIFFSLFLLLNIKLIHLQLYSHDKYYQQAVAQRSMDVKLSDNRGVIYDKNMIPLVNNNPVKYAVVFPELITNKKEAITILEYITLENNLDDKLSSKKPFTLKVRKINEAYLNKLKENHVFIIDDFERYGENNVARHIIGYTAFRDYHGISGIEKAYDKFLYSTQGKYVGLVQDALHNSIDGLGIRMRNEQEFKGELNVKLTLDFHIQKIVEEIMDEKKISGAVVLLKPKTGDIVAMASRPQFNPNNIKEHINSNGSELINRALSSFNVGSIFKIVVAASALEKGTAFMSDIFYCDGGNKVQDKYFNCPKEHGLMNLSQAFAQSCNSSFIDIGLRTGKNNILNMAKKMGYGNYTHITKLGLNEAKGNLPSDIYSSDKEIANISIGQGDILASPLQVAVMISTVVNNGVKTNANLVDSIIDSNGRIVKKIKCVNKKRIFTPYTAQRLKIIMRKVVEEGTGKEADIPQFGGSAGKTGTAQTGWLQDGLPKVHAWFAGYFPFENPEYVLVVFVDNGKSGSQVSAPIFNQIAFQIMKLSTK